MRSLPVLGSVSRILPILIGSNEVEMKPSAASDVRRDRRSSGAQRKHTDRWLPGNRRTMLTHRGEANDRDRDPHQRRIDGCPRVRRRTGIGAACGQPSATRRRPGLLGIRRADRWSATAARAAVGRHHRHRQSRRTAAGRPTVVGAQRHPHRRRLRRRSARNLHADRDRRQPERRRAAPLPAWGIPAPGPVDGCAGQPLRPAR